MGLFNIATVFLTIATLFNSIEFSSSMSAFVHPAPNPVLRPPSYRITDGRVYLTGESVAALPVIVGDYFLGTFDNNRIHQVDPYDRHAIIRISTGRFIHATDEFLAQLQERFLAYTHILRTSRRHYTGEGSSHQGARGSSG